MICVPYKLNVLLVIELDDRTQRRQGPQTRHHDEGSDCQQSSGIIFGRTDKELCLATSRPSYIPYHFPGERRKVSQVTPLSGFRNSTAFPATADTAPESAVFHTALYLAFWWRPKHKTFGQSTVMSLKLEPCRAPGLCTTLRPPQSLLLTHHGPFIIAACSLAHSGGNRESGTMFGRDNQILGVLLPHYILMYAKTRVYYAILSLNSSFAPLIVLYVCHSDLQPALSR